MNEHAKEERTVREFQSRKHSVNLLIWVRVVAIIIFTEAGIIADAPTPCIPRRMSRAIMSRNTTSIDCYNGGMELNILGANPQARVNTAVASDPTQKVFFRPYTSAHLPHTR